MASPECGTGTVSASDDTSTGDSAACDDGSNTTMVRKDSDNHSVAAIARRRDSALFTINVPRIKKVCPEGTTASLRRQRFPLQLPERSPTGLLHEFSPFDLSYSTVPVRGVIDMMGRYDVPPSTVEIP